MRVLRPREVSSYALQLYRYVEGMGRDGGPGSIFGGSCSLFEPQFPPLLIKMMVMEMVIMFLIGFL